MDGVFYGLSIVAVFIVIVWFVRNRDVPDGRPTRGLLAIKQADAQSPQNKGARKKWSRGQSD
jgi:hypothetical protein